MKTTVKTIEIADLLGKESHYKKTWLEKIQSSIKKGTGDTENKVLVKKKNF